MKVLFLILVCAHGLIHLMGFGKAYELADLKQLAQPISKPMGSVWLAGFVLFTFAAVMFGFKNSYWWLVGFIAVAVSQYAIIFSWHDAKFGTIANVIILIGCIVGYGTWSYNAKYQKDVNAGLHRCADFQKDVLAENDMEQLPEPVKRYLRYTGCIGKPKVYNFRIIFTGRIRKNEQTQWMPFTSEQYNFMDIPTRLFFMKAVMKGLPVAGYHCYMDGVAFMDIRLFSLVKVQYKDGVEMDLAETVTFFNDMCCMAPATLIDKRIQWLDTEGNRVRASFTVGKNTIYAWLYFNDKGELVNFSSNDRYDADAGKKLPWATPLTGYKEINGYKLAGSAEAIYSYPDRDLCYGVFSLSDIEYNCR